MDYVILAFYHLTPLADPDGEVKAHKLFFEGRDVRGRLYISHEGIYGQMSASRDAAQTYVEWLRSRDGFADVKFKEDSYPEHAFPRMTVKVREQLVAMDHKVDLSHRGDHVSPEKWRDMLERREADIVLDVRNEYEWEIGRFKGAVVPPCDTFRQFPAYVRELKKSVDPEKGKVMMYCTGGIRCEFYSALLRKEGFKQVFQLEGGVINYGHQVGAKHWEGKLFVFDDRLAAPVADEPTESVGVCHLCKGRADHPYNCANMDCNYLFICCSQCLPKHSGCCSAECEQGERVRPLSHQAPGKPFRKWYHYRETKR